MKVLPAILLFILCSQIATAADNTKELQDLINSHAGGVCQLENRVYTIYSPFTIPSNTELRGSDNTVIEFGPNCGIGQNIPMIDLTSVENVKISYIHFRGNQDSQTYAYDIPNPGHPNSGKAYGNQVNTFIYAKYSSNLTVTYCDFFDNLGDGLRCSNCANIEFAFNTGSKGGHDTFFVLRSQGIKVHNNNISPKVNSAFRLLDCSHAAIYYNIITAPIDLYSNPSIQIEEDTADMTNIEVCGNTIRNSCGPGIWVIGLTSSTQEAYIHHNAVYNAGWNPGIGYVGGITISGYNNILLEHNVFDSCYLSSVNVFSSAENTRIDSNIFTSAVRCRNNGVGGYGIYCTGGSVSSSNNCYWNNAANTQGCTLSQTDLFVDPKVAATPSGWSWDGSKWVCPDYTVGDIGYIPSLEGDYRNPVPEEEIQKLEFSNIFDIWNLEFTDSAYDVKQDKAFAKDPKWETKDYSEAYIYLAGYEGQITLNNKTYIPKVSWKCAKVFTGTRNLAPRPVSQSSSLKLSEGVNNGLHAELEVKTLYNEKERRTAKILGKSISFNSTVQKSQTKAYTKDFPAPEVFPAITENDLNISVKYYNNSYNPHVVVTIEPKNGTQNVFREVTYHYNGSTATDSRLLGYVSSGDNGFKISDYEKTSRWISNSNCITYEYLGAYIPGYFNPALLTVDVATPYENITIKSFKVEEIGDTTQNITVRNILCLFIILLFLGGFAVAIIRNFSLSFGRIR
jgi:hypothetical protein